MQHWTLYGQLFQKDGGVTGDESMSNKDLKVEYLLIEKEFFYTVKDYFSMAESL